MGSESGGVKRKKWGRQIVDSREMGCHQNGVVRLGVQRNWGFEEIGLSSNGVIKVVGRS